MIFVTERLPIARIFDVFAETDDATALQILDDEHLPSIGEEWEPVKGFFLVCEHLFATLHDKKRHWIVTARYRRRHN